MNLRKEKMKKYNLVVDAGNTNVVFAIYQNEIIIRQTRVETRKQDCRDFYYQIIADFLTGYQSKIKNSAISSVVPTLTETLVDIISELAARQPLVVDYNSDLGLTYDMPDSSHLGSDLVVNAFAAKEKYRQNCLICDLGTATTIQLVSGEGVFFGAAIIPGLRTAAESLFQRASKLNPIELEIPKSLLGKTTKDAVLSGIINGHLFILEGFVSRLKNEYFYGGKTITIATGGLAEMVCGKAEFIDVIDKNLLLDGLNSICNKLG